MPNHKLYQMFCLKNPVAVLLDNDVASRRHAVNVPYVTTAALEVAESSHSEISTFF